MKEGASEVEGQVVDAGCVRSPASLLHSSFRSTQQQQAASAHPSATPCLSRSRLYITHDSRVGAPYSNATLNATL